MLPQDALGLQNFMMSLGSSSPNNSSRDSPGSAPVHTPDVNTTVNRTKSTASGLHQDLPPHLASAQDFVCFKVEAHPLYGDKDGRGILSDIEEYAKQLNTSPDRKDPESYRKLRSIPRISASNTEAFQAALRLQLPIILTDAPLVSSSCSRWTPEFLAHAFGSDRELTVYSSDSEYFRYWHRPHHSGGYPFRPPTEIIKMSFPEFVRKTADALRAKRAGEPHMLFYMQENLSSHPELASEFKSWDWKWLLNLVSTYGWGV